MGGSGAVLARPEGWMRPYTRHPECPAAAGLAQLGAGGTQPQRPMGLDSGARQVLVDEHTACWGCGQHAPTAPPPAVRPLGSWQQPLVLPTARGFVKADLLARQRPRAPGGTVTMT